MVGNIDEAVEKAKTLTVQEEFDKDDVGDQRFTRG